MTTIASELHDALVNQFADRWIISENRDLIHMTHRRPAGPSVRHRPLESRAIVERLRHALASAGLPTEAALLPQRWTRDTDLLISAVQALDPWLKDRHSRVWREGFLPQPVVRFTGERTHDGRLADGYLTSFANISYVQRINSARTHARLLDHWITALSAIGIHAGRLTIYGCLEVWHRPPVAGLTLLIDCDGRSLGDAVLLWNDSDSSFMATDLGSGLERLSWYLSGEAWPRSAFGQLADSHDVALLDATRTATLLIMGGIRSGHRGAGWALRSVAHLIDPRAASTGLSRLVREHHRYWSGLGVNGPSWPHVASYLEDEVLRPRLPTAVATAQPVRAR
jgi:hypothetical protein